MTHSNPVGCFAHVSATIPACSHARAVLVVFVAFANGFNRISLSSVLPPEQGKTPPVQEHPLSRCRPCRCSRLLRKKSNPPHHHRHHHPMQLLVRIRQSPRHLFLCKCLSLRQVIRLLIRRIVVLRLAAVMCRLRSSLCIVPPVLSVCSRSR